jgi:hypothetical protein
MVYTTGPRLQDSSTPPILHTPTFLHPWPTPHRPHAFPHSPSTLPPEAHLTRSRRLPASRRCRPSLTRHLQRHHGHINTTRQHWVRLITSSRRSITYPHKTTPTFSAITTDSESYKRVSERLKKNQRAWNHKRGRTSELEWGCL